MPDITKTTLSDPSPGAASPAPGTGSALLDPMAHILDYAHELADKKPVPKPPPIDTAAVSALTRAWEGAGAAAGGLVDRGARAGGSVAPVSPVSVEGRKELLRQLSDARMQQTRQAIDNQVLQSAEQLRRAEAEAAARFSAARDQIAAEELRGLDDQALYAEARGDRGGIGQAQYGALRNTAARSRLAVNQQQLRLSTDTERQIEALRAQGEFEKADKLLDIAQSYMKELLALEQWAQEKNLSIEEFNNQLARWQQDYDLSVSKYLTDTELSAAQLSGVFPDGTPTRSVRSEMNAQLAEMGMAMLKKGLMPTDEQLAAMGMTRAQAAAYIM